MKKLIISAALLVTAIGMSAQNYLLNNPDNHAYFGARVGLDVTSASGYGDPGTYVNSPGFHIGAIYNIPLVSNLYFEPGLHIFYDTFGSRINMGVENAAMMTVANGSIRNFGFRIPFNFGYRFDFTDEISVSVYTGPVLNVNLTAHQSWNNPVIDGKITDLSELDGSVFGTGGFKRTDFQWQFGAGISYMQYYLTIGGGVGITNVYKGPLDGKILDDSFRRNTFNLAVGYNF